MAGLLNSKPGGKADPPDTVIKAHVASLRLLLAGWITHFRSVGYVKEGTMDMLDRKVCKRTVDLTIKELKVREAIGLNAKVWGDLVDLFRSASPSLESRSYAPIDPANPGYDGPNSNAIVFNSVSLLKDLQRLDNMLAIARNVLTAGETVQNLAAQIGFDREVCSMINLCIKITARGYDGDGTALEEDKWQGVMNGFKKLLITSLQFLSNLVTLNERLKLMLWVELFDAAPDSITSNIPEPRLPAQDMNVDKWVRNAIEDFKHQQAQQQIQHAVRASSDAITLTPRDLFEWDQEEAIMKYLIDTNPNHGPEQITKETDKRWNSMTDKEREPWTSMPAAMVAQMKESIFRVPDFAAAGLPKDRASVDESIVQLAKLDIDDPKYRDQIQAMEADRDGDQSKSEEKRSSTESFWRAGMMETAADGARKLHEGKTQLLKRLEHIPVDQSQPAVIDSPSSPTDPPAIPSQDANIVDSGHGTDDEIDPGLDDEEEEDDEEDEEDDEDDLEEDASSDEEDYAIPGEDGRGLLTDVPLILGPNEIEVLPMIIMSGIVVPDESNAPTKSSTEDHGPINMYTIRCHLLLAQENGRNLLRELLIFVAAWDLREEELYFKFMVKIMEAILLNGLMPFAYGAFKESKDIISPAQAVIMKLLTKIFHSRQKFISSPQPTPSRFLPGAGGKDPHAAPAQHRYDVQVVHCLFSEFRQNIIPQICALIFLQGQIRIGHATVEDFPLNLWDMERMYEGVYQYLEFFAILTDHNHWKRLMAEWQVTSELLTLLNELEIAIPKGRPLQQQQQHQQQQHAPPPPPPPPPIPSAQQLAPNTATANKPAGPVPVAVERPYDIHAPAEPIPPASTPLTPDSYPPHTIPSAPFTQAPQSTYPPLPQSQQHPHHRPQPPPPDDPATFEWRNLKKLCILVLSSLVWKNRRLQNQVRRFNGIPTILACCVADEHNPYVREHAIMCLRFLVEGNAANRRVVEGIRRGGWVEVRRGAVVVGRENGGGGKVGASGKGGWMRVGALSEEGGEGDSETDEEETEERHEEEEKGKNTSDDDDDDDDDDEHASDPDANDRDGRPDEQTQLAKRSSARKKKETVRVQTNLTVPVEVLDQHGYETFVDAKGQVGLRRKEQQQQQQQRQGQGQGEQGGKGKGTETGGVRKVVA